MSDYAKIERAMQKTLRQKMEAYDKLKARWDMLVGRGEALLKRNYEQAEAYFHDAMDLEPELLAKLNDMYRLRQILLGVAKRVR